MPRICLHVLFACVTIVVQKLFSFLYVSLGNYGQVGHLLAVVEALRVGEPHELGVAVGILPAVVQQPPQSAALRRSVYAKVLSSGVKVVHITADVLILLIQFFSFLGFLRIYQVASVFYHKLVSFKWLRTNNTSAFHWNFNNLDVGFNIIYNFVNNFRRFLSLFKYITLTFTSTILEKTFKSYFFFNSS